MRCAWRPHGRVRVVPELADDVDVLSVVGIECWGHHGVFDHERRDGQRFVIDLALAVDTRPA
ncbi:MAG TPA: dihydroneopterin aldolase, partial [Nocardioides sp.]|nr:dihydroneopterin aldolase [Nocardioides sp.]